MKHFKVLGLAVLTFSCAHGPQPNAQHTTSAPQSTVGARPVVALVEPLALFDEARQRSIPVAVYQPRRRSKAPLKAAIFSHGYGGQHTGYSFLAQNLVAHGYLVASIQHELPTDAPLPMTGNVRETRLPNWERGVQNILFVRQELQKKYPKVDFSQLLLVGHSNGGDMAMLLAEKHPELVQQIISLDNRRVPFPRARQPRVLSLRSSDQVADDGVLPTPAEQQLYGTTIVTLPNTIHNDMWDGATEAQKQEMNSIISRFLEK
ncbi:alpha/beta hydrolase family protein [Hymenobacter arizonensis]|uniref:Alpha/beta hydrolase family protein n=1 Tax=Hymenobacter arizonensis TaxID=1227077 RepID=A0A1I5UVT9_HYMAR|nr:alpha/beta hydrolase [Hymenobacter arizonensis]SFP98826.1 Alpha/beta hydrolase family protein [Hymenobacter arizonensis]